MRVAPGVSKESDISRSDPCIPHGVWADGSQILFTTTGATMETSRVVLVADRYFGVNPVLRPTSRQTSVCGSGGPRAFQSALELVF